NRVRTALAELPFRWFSRGWGWDPSYSRSVSRRFARGVHRSEQPAQPGPESRSRFERGRRFPVAFTRQSPRRDPTGAGPSLRCGAGSAGRSIGTPAASDHVEGLADDRQVAAQRPVLDVVDIQVDHAGIVQLAPAPDLPGAGDAGEDLEPSPVGLG